MNNILTPNCKDKYIWRTYIYAFIKEYNTIVIFDDDDG